MIVFIVMIQVKKINLLIIGLCLGNFSKLYHLIIFSLAIDKFIF
jgi:hypothetical protein